MYEMWVGSLPHSLRIRLQCDAVETPDACDFGWTADGAGDGALRSAPRCWINHEPRFPPSRS